MSKRHGAREQKRLAKQKAKRKAKRRQVALRESPDPTVQLKAPERWPVVATLVPDNLWEAGIGNLIIARRMPDGRLACGIFLLDVWCLGVKEACWKILSAGEFKEVRKHFEEHALLKDTPPEYFAKLVYRAADYGQSLGFPPHHDFRHAQRLLAGIDPSQCPDEFEFGQDGRPHYIRGPNESMEKARAIAAQVEALGGNYTLPVDSSDLDDIECVDDWDDEHEWDEEGEIDDFDEGEFERDTFEAVEDDPVEETEQARPRRRWWPPWQ